MPWIKVQLLSRREKITVAKHLVGGSLLGGMCYGIGLGLGRVGLFSIDDVDPYELRHYFALLFYGASVTCWGYAGFCLDRLLEQLSTPGRFGQYTGLGLLGLIPLLMLFGLFAAIVICIIIAVNGGHP